MTKNYRLLTEAVRTRLNPESFLFSKDFTDELSSISYSDVLTYIKFAMKSVEPQYTQRSIDAGEKVKNHLSNSLSNTEFRYQGSVMTNTHIKGYSDIDLLSICNKFYTFNSHELKDVLNNEGKRSSYYASDILKMENQMIASVYQGNSLQDLKDLRIRCEQVLGDVYQICDKTKPKSIKIKNLSLSREVDIVIANWYDDLHAVINNKGDSRGVQIYNKESHSTESPDYPFISIARINQKNTATNGRLKKMIRFLKNIKVASEQNIELSSFDINAVCYNIESSQYASVTFTDLVSVLFIQLKNICNDKSKADSIVSVDGRDYIFRTDFSKIENLKKILIEIEGIYLDLYKKNYVS